ncbi:hypothetical protein GRAN_3832 [Granulicella sibirica]|uniref:Uncharacterized protein n=1 Tax=Granulicella sibirica TaxID=2479048 RepID=A0A4Q0SYM3_9BACT|nr:hypothetical protein GRAN_3832 [Granulicella sibirica]
MVAARADLARAAAAAVAAAWERNLRRVGFGMVAPGGVDML